MEGWVDGKKDGEWIMEGWMNEWMKNGGWINGWTMNGCKSR